MPVLHQHVARGETVLTPTMVNLLIALVVLFATIALLIGTLLIFRQMRRKQKEAEVLHSEAGLPMYSEKDEYPSSSSTRASRLIISTPGYSEKEALMRGASTPSSPDVPEIRITFPEEVDESGRRTSGRVVVVKVGEHSVGMEPVRQEDLPPYPSREEGGKFESLDLDRMGGLKEKDMR
jgi:hypothetical protein